MMSEQHPLTPVEMMEEWETNYPTTTELELTIAKADKKIHQRNNPIPETHTLVAIDNETERIVANFGTRLPKGDIDKHLPHLNCRIELLSVNQYNYIMQYGNKHVDEIDLKYAYQRYNNNEGNND